MKKFVLFIAMAMFLIGGSAFAQVSKTQKDAIIKPKPAVHSSKTSIGLPDKRHEKVRKEDARRKASQVNINANNPNAPVITFETLEHDFGTMKQGGNGTFDFVFKNDGKEPLILSNVRSTCGCTIPTWPKHPIMPGESEKIRVKYDTKRIGPFHKAVHIYSNAKKSTVTLKIKGVIERDPNAPVNNRKKPIHKPAPKKNVKKQMSSKRK